MLETDVIGTDECREAGVCRAAQIEGDIAIEKAHGKFMPLFTDKAELLEVGRPDDLASVSVSTLCHTPEFCDFVCTFSMTSSLISFERLSNVTFPAFFASDVVLIVLVSVST